MPPHKPEDEQALRRKRRLTILRWLPILVYFVVKYLVLGNDLSRPQLIGLIAFVVLAEIALWLYGRQINKQYGTD